MSVFIHSIQVPGLVAFNIVAGMVLVRGIMRLVARLTEEAPSPVFIGVPAIVLVTSASLAIWTLAMA